MKLGQILFVSFSLIILGIHLFLLRMWDPTCSVTFVTRARKILLCIAGYGQFITLLMLLAPWEGWLRFLLISWLLFFVALVVFTLFKVFCAEIPKDGREASVVRRFRQQEQVAKEKAAEEAARRREEKEAEKEAAKAEKEAKKEEKAARIAEKQARGGNRGSTQIVKGVRADFVQINVGGGGQGYGEVPQSPPPPPLSGAPPPPPKPGQPQPPQQPAAEYYDSPYAYGQQQVYFPRTPSDLYLPVPPPPPPRPGAPPPPPRPPVVFNNAY